MPVVVGRLEPGEEEEGPLEYSATSAPTFLIPSSSSGCKVLKEEVQDSTLILLDVTVTSNGCNIGKFSYTTSIFVECNIE